MKIIVPRLPKQATKKELQQLLEEKLATRFRLPFTTPPSVRTCEIFSYLDNNGVVDFHGIATIEPDDAAKWLLKNFKDLRLHSKLVLGREYQEREFAADKMLDTDADRRREGVEVNRKGEAEKVNVSPLEQYARTHVG